VGTCPENPVFVYTKYQQEETIHKYGLPPRLRLLSRFPTNSLCSLETTKQRKAPSSFECSAGAKCPEVPLPLFFRALPFLFDVPKKKEMEKRKEKRKWIFFSIYCSFARMRK
jgi:hypothetical protein